MHRRKQRSALTCTFLAAALLGCASTRNSPPGAVAPPPKTVPASPTKPAPPTSYEISAEQKRDMYMGCWSFFNSRKLEKILDCYHSDASFEVVGSHCPIAKGPATYLQRISDFLLAVPDATAKLQLTLAHDDTVVGVALIRGTHTGPLKTPEGEIPATNKKVGFLFGHVVEFEKNRIARDRWFRDPNTVLSQIGKGKLKGRKAISEGATEKPALASENSNEEESNVGVFNNYFAALNTHDLERVEPLVAEDYVYSNQFVSKDYDGRRQAMKYHESLFKAFSNLKIEHASVFGVGDFVVGLSTFTGTNDGPLRSWNLWKGSDRSVSLAELDILQVVDGQVQKHLVFADGDALARQLGLADAPPEGADCTKSVEEPDAAEPKPVDMDADAAKAPAASDGVGASEPEK